MDGHVSLKDLQLLWGVIRQLVCGPLRGLEVKLLIVSARMIKSYYLSWLEFVHQLKRVHVDVKHLCWPCGHYSLGILPFSLMGLVRASYS